MVALPCILLQMCSPRPRDMSRCKDARGNAQALRWGRFGGAGGGRAPGAAKRPRALGAQALRRSRCTPTSRGRSWMHRRCGAGGHRARGWVLLVNGARCMGDASPRSVWRGWRCGALEADAAAMRSRECEAACWSYELSLSGWFSIVTGGGLHGWVAGGVHAGRMN